MGHIKQTYLLLLFFSYKTVGVIYDFNIIEKQNKKKKLITFQIITQKYYLLIDPAKD